MKYEPIIRNGVMIFNLRKAIYGSFYGVWDKWLKIATKRGLKLVVHTNEGTATFESAKEYLKGAKRLERYYKNPNEPMVFWSMSFLPEVLKRDKRKKAEKKEEAKQQNLIGILDKMREEQPEMYKKLRGVFL
jgi:hypothetical protein